MITPSSIVSIAPMMDRTDRHFRYLVRLISHHSLLYTEMITTAAILYGDRPKLLDYSPEEKPLVLQLGGDNPKQLAECARIAEAWGYDEVNLNVGCPSPRVQEGNFGACLMLDPHLVAQGVKAMKSGVKIPVTVKHRIGVDEQDDYQDLAQFVKIVAEAGCDRFTVHARKAWLKGLSPKENRTIPPLCYDLVYRLKEDCPHLCIEINGGITQLEAVQKHLQLVDAVMIGRAAYDNPYLLAEVDREIYHSPFQPLTRHQVVNKMLPYIEAKLSAGVRLNSVSRHLLNLFTHTPGSRAWKRHITENAHLPGADVSVITQALACVPHYALQNI